MSLTWDDLDGEQEIKAWELIAGRLPPQPATADLLTPPIHTKLATLFVRSRRKLKESVFLTADQLFNIATEEMIEGRIKSENDLDEVPAIYIFLDLSENEVLKVGQAGILRKRIATDHLRYGQSLSDLRQFSISSGWDWPKCLRDRNIVLTGFAFRNSCAEERCFIEFGLKELLHPKMS